MCIRDSGKRDDLSKFISCGDFAIENVSNSYKYLLFEIINTKHNKKKILFSPLHNRCV